MSEMRFNPITLDWVVMAPDRALKPDDFHKEQPVRPAQPAHRDTCPFCTGNEQMAPDEICRAVNAEGAWAVRVVPNKYSVFIATDDLRRKTNGVFHSMAAAGAHEVVVEHPRHDLSLADMGVAHLAAILRIYRERYQVLKQNPVVESIVIFKNHGERAGTSLEHAHSQITAAPIISPQVYRRLEEARRFHEVNGACLCCQVMHEELEADERIVEAGSSFVTFVPYASLSPYHVWIFPRRHAPSFDEISDAEIVELSGMLSRQLRRNKLVANDPDYNFSIRSAPVREASSGCFHWYLAIVPRVNQIAGFELGSGTFINSLHPERSAEQLRSVVLEQ